MGCDECLKLDAKLLESMVAADRAETGLRCFFLTHHRVAGVADLDEYNALNELARHSQEQRHRAYLACAQHRQQHA